jgi:hypothetical protein
MCDHITAKSLFVGGIEFRCDEPIGWPVDGPLSCYRGFLSKPATDRTPDAISVGFASGLPTIDRKLLKTFESDDGICWSRAGSYHLVGRLVPHMSSSPLWVIRISLENRRAVVHFSDLVMAGDEQCGGWPLAAIRYPIDQHMMLHYLPGMNGALLHAAGAGLMNGGGFLCAGKSGSGKTTISRLLTDHGGISLLTDDRVITRSTGSGGFTMHGTPWTGDGQYASPGTAPLAAAFFLVKDLETRAKRLTPAEAMERYLPVTSIPWFDEDLTRRTLAHLEKLARTIPAYELHFTKTPEVASLVAAHV